MGSCYPQSLFDLCGIRIAYLMWTHQDVYRENYEYIRGLFHFRASFLSGDIQKLNLTKQCESCILEKVVFSGRQLIFLLLFWMSKTKLKHSQANSLKNMFYESLVLNSEGLINLRKTAEKLLGRRKLPAEFAFRLACINFLEKEVFELWIDVRQYFLNQITLRNETEEVLLWIYNCLLKDNPAPRANFLKGSILYSHCLKWAVSSGNVAYLDYLKNFSSEKIRYANSIIKYIFIDAQNFKQLDYYQACAIFYLKLLNLEEKSELFREYPDEMVHLYLNWPLSQTFVENAEEIWKLIPDEYKSKVFVKIFKYLYGENEDEMFEYNFMPIRWATGNYSFKHLAEIWDSLWKICLDSYKLDVLNEFIFRSFEKFVVRKIFYTDFDNSILKRNLLKSFLSNGKAVFELYRGKNLKQSLMIFIAKHLPQDFKELNRRYFKETPKIKTIKYPGNYSISIPCHTEHPVCEDILKCIEELLPSNRK